jgi:hypothetical protein
MNSLCGGTHLSIPKGPGILHLLNQPFILSVNKAGVVRIREHHHSSARNLSAKMFDFLLVIFRWVLRNSWTFVVEARATFPPSPVFLVTDGEERKRCALILSYSALAE